VYECSSNTIAQCTLNAHVVHHLFVSAPLSTPYLSTCHCSTFSATHAHTAEPATYVE
jgi:hypothetical protein